MKTQTFTKLFFALLALFSATAMAGNFTNGKLAVLQVAASANNTTGSVLEINPATAAPQTPSNTVVISGAGTDAIRFSGSATSTGYLGHTADGMLITFTGANNTDTSSNVNTLNPRAVGTLDYAGTFVKQTTYTGTSGNQTRGASSLNGTSWFIGDQGGFYTNGASTASPTGNIRSVKAFGTTMYAGTASTTAPPVGIISSATGGTYTGLTGLANGTSNVQDFYLVSSAGNSTYDVLYVLAATSNTAGTISKFSLVSGSWTANGSYTTTFGGFGLAAAKNGAGAVLYVTTGQGALTANSVIKLADTAGFNATIAITTGNNVTLYTAAAGTILKGVDFSPLAPPLPDLAVSVSAPATAAVNTNFDYTLTASNQGTADATGVAVDFTVPAGLAIQSAAGTGFSTSTAGQVVHFTGGAITAGANATLTVTVSASTGATYTAPADSAVIDPAAAITELNEANNASIAAATTDVLVAPAITTQPNPSQTIPSGGTANLTVAASGYLAPTYQWYRGVSGDTTNPVGGATSANFTTPALTLTTSYWARATNATGTADSNTAVVNVSSGNANLGNLVLSAGALTPPFASGTLSYTITVPFGTLTTTVTPTTADANATVKVNTVTVASGSPSSDINLNVGDNTMTVAVTAQDLVTIQTYTVTVHRQSNHADLDNLTLSSGTLTPAFAAGITSYTASVSNATASVMVTPTVADSNATVKVNTTSVASGSPVTVPLVVGPNTITVAVTAEDLSVKNYSVVVTRTGSSNADLSGLVLSTGAYSPAFAANKTAYVQFVPSATASLTVTPTLADANAVVTVNTAPVASGVASDAINLVEGVNTITVVVTAQDGTTTKTYTATVVRQANVVLGPGAIAFTGMNTDGVDNLAFVALQNLPAHTVIFFSDDEWNTAGTDWVDAGESAFAWMATGAVSAGTIITLDSVSTVYSGTTVPSTGVIIPNPEGTQNAGLSNGAEAVYAFQGTGALNANGNLVPTAFLALIANDDPTAGAFSITNTGLTEAAGTAIIFTESDDGVRYKGARNGLLNFADYLPLLADRAANWESVAGGDGTTYLPFSTAPFTAGPVALVTINDVSIAEGDSGTSTLNFTVTRGNNLGDFTVHYATANGTGAHPATTADNDYQSTSGDLTFIAGGALTQQVSVTINGDTTVEHDETFFVNLTNLVSTSGNAIISDAQGVGTITNDDAFAPVFTTQPLGQPVATGASATLTVATDAFPVATYQWYSGASGDITNPVSGATSSSYTTPVLLADASYWVRATNAQDSADSNTAVLTVAYAAPNSSANINILNPNTASWNPAGVSVGGTQFVNLGLQGVGRFPASAKDPVTGESIGSISDMQITGWHKNGDGSYSGTMNTLPDRGYNSGAIFSNYAARINEYAITFTPYTASTPTTDQHQVVMNFVGSTRFTYDHDGSSTTPPVFTTGLLANGGTPLFGTIVPVVTGPSTQSDGTVNNRLTLDSEGLILDSRFGKTGSGWVGDEYGAYIYHFNSDKVMDGVVTLPESLIPHATSGGPISFIDVPANVDGRRVNQGMEGIAQSPDGTKLFGLMQSATMQDSGSGSQGRFNTRLLVYNISASDTPTVPAAQYVIQLPRIDDTGLTNNGNSVDKTAAQSSIVALNDHQLLILSRDGNGRGVPGSASPVFKSILLADLSTATDINGQYDAAGNAVAPAGVLTVGVTPISWTEALNMIGKLDSTLAEVTKFGLNLQGGNGDINTICEKWESLGLVSAKDPVYPNDYFLFIGNDNDFLSATGKYLDANGDLQDYDAGLENDTLVLAFRVRFTTPEILVQQPAGSDVDNGGSVDFGTSAPSGTTTKTFTVKNPGAAPLLISTIEVTGADAASFGVDLTGTALTLAPATETTFAVTFTAPASGSKTTTLHIVSNDFNDGTYTATLNGATNHAPMLVLPTSPVIAEATSTAGAMVDFTLSATDAEDGNTLVPTPDHASHSQFAIGDTTVHVSVTDTAGVTTNGSFVVRVQDTTAPAGGSLGLSPSGTVRAGTPVLAQATGWTDISTPLTYEFFLDTVSLGAPQTGSAYNFTSLTAGAHDVSVVVRDAVGNAAAAAHASVTVDLGEITSVSVYSKGGAVPGAGTDARIQSGALWTGFNAPAVNDAGHLAYIGRWKSPASTGVKAQAGTGLFVDDTLIVKTTEAVPGITGAVFKTLRDPVIDAHGHVAFIAIITNATGGSAVTPSNDMVVVSNAAGTLEVLAREGDAAPDANNALYKVFSNVSVKDDSTLFTASLLQGSGTPAAAPANDAGVWWKPTGSASVLKLIREGDAGFTAGETIKSFAILKPFSGSAGQGRGQLDGASALLQVNLIKGGLVTQAVVVATPGNLGLVVEGNDTLGGTALPNAVWQKLGLPSSDDAGSTLSLLGGLRVNVGTVAAGHTLGIFQSTNGGTTWEPVVRAGSTPPGITDASIFTSFKDPVNSATDAGVAFIGTSKLGKIGATGIWYQPEGGALSLIALQGRQPDTGPVGAKWRAFTSLALPGGGLGPVFIAGLEKGPNGTPGPGGIDNSNDVGLYAVDSVGVLHELIREGNTIGGKTVKVFSVLKALAGSAGSTRSFNSTGAIVVLVTFSDGSSTILRFHIPS